MSTLKHGQRAQMLPTARDLWPAACELQNSTAAQNNALSRCCQSLSPDESSSPHDCEWPGVRLSEVLKASPLPCRQVAITQSLGAACETPQKL